ncbi:MAG: hypothetical protein AB1830_13075 [Pseudomonadota bacterium]
MFTDHAGDAWMVAALAFLGASFAGLANQLRLHNTVTWRSIVAALLNSGFVGLIVAMLGYKTFQDNLPYLYGISLLAGIGGASLLDFMIEGLRRWLSAFVGSGGRQ